MMFLVTDSDPLLPITTGVNLTGPTRGYFLAFPVADIADTTATIETTFTYAGEYDGVSEETLQIKHVHTLAGYHYYSIPWKMLTKITSGPPQPTNFTIVNTQSASDGTWPAEWGTIDVAVDIGIITDDGIRAIIPSDGITTSLSENGEYIMEPNKTACIYFAYDIGDQPYVDEFVFIDADTDQIVQRRTVTTKNKFGELSPPGEWQGDGMRYEIDGCLETNNEGFLDPADATAAPVKNLKIVSMWKARVIEPPADFEYTLGVSAMGDVTVSNSLATWTKEESPNPDAWSIPDPDKIKLEPAGSDLVIHSVNIITQNGGTVDQTVTNKYYNDSVTTVSSGSRFMTISIGSGFYTGVTSALVLIEIEFSSTKNITEFIFGHSEFWSTVDVYDAERAVVGNNEYGMVWTDTRADVSKIYISGPPRYGADVTVQQLVDAIAPYKSGGQMPGFMAPNSSGCFSLRYQTDGAVRIKDWAFVNADTNVLGFTKQNTQIGNLEDNGYAYPTNCMHTNDSGFIYYGQAGYSPIPRLNILARMEQNPDHQGFNGLAMDLSKDYVIHVDSVLDGKTWAGPIVMPQWGYSSGDIDDSGLPYITGVMSPNSSYANNFLLGVRMLFTVTDVTTGGRKWFIYTQSAGDLQGSTNVLNLATQQTHSTFWRCYFSRTFPNGSTNFMNAADPDSSDYFLQDIQFFRPNSHDFDGFTATLYESNKQDGSTVGSALGTFTVGYDSSMVRKWQPTTAQSWDQAQNIPGEPTL